MTPEMLLKVFDLQCCDLPQAGRAGTSLEELVETFKSYEEAHGDPPPRFLARYYWRLAVHQMSSEGGAGVDEELFTVLTSLSDCCGDAAVPSPSDELMLNVRLPRPPRPPSGRACAHAPPPRLRTAQVKTEVVLSHLRGDSAAKGAALKAARDALLTHFPEASGGRAEASRCAPGGALRPMGTHARRALRGRPQAQEAAGGAVGRRRRGGCAAEQAPCGRGCASLLRRV